MPWTSRTGSRLVLQRRRHPVSRRNRRSQSGPASPPVARAPGANLRTPGGNPYRIRRCARITSYNVCYTKLLRNLNFLEAYHPNETFYLPENIRHQLRQLGTTPEQEKPAGTFARDILNRLLIDLSWASSHLEGNTYSRLDTERLIEHGQIAEGKDVITSYSIHYTKLYDDGSLKLLYVAPERLANERFLNRLRGRSIALLAIDEAHCISEWGHNFRPEYLKIARLAQELNVGRVLALTATATPRITSYNVCYTKLLRGIWILCSTAQKSPPNG